TSWLSPTGSRLRISGVAIGPGLHPPPPRASRPALQSSSSSVGGGPTRPIARAEPFADDALEAKLAGGAEDKLPVIMLGMFRAVGKDLRREPREIRDIQLAVHLIMNPLGPVGGRSAGEGSASGMR